MLTETESERGTRTAETRLYPPVLQCSLVRREIMFALDDPVFDFDDFELLLSMLRTIKQRRTQDVFQVQRSGIRLSR